MCDLILNESYLREAATDMSNLSEDLKGLCDELRSAEAVVVGARPLFRELSDFAEDWSKCTDELSEFAEKSGVHIQNVIDTFEELDQYMCTGMEVPNG